ncbi:aminodeoxychorismate/anthranilate synthase component II [Aciduricibacillus chroicocephali]|uniref:Aminodeoxychorismate/anthranilate synthase component II n=1 Tax=Aciduricibacillus chroicocephali TaxID=3054939 RepID=A0ABY9KXI4_9BACI|nr:aminodeoxychorismate/anthranilate synthase component II [Bacillaceae bacterium 44XB]
MILLIDNYDSFTYNIFQYVSELAEEVRVVRNDEITVQEIKELAPEAIIISPGPGLPSEAGICNELVTKLHKETPILGICLGHQVIGEALGGKVVKAGAIKHGKTSSITHNGHGPFSYLEQPLEVMRYHSYVVDKISLPLSFKVMATALDDKEIMAMQYRDYPVYGIQFHPESIGTDTGKRMISNFLGEIRKGSQNETVS